MHRYCFLLQVAPDRLAEYRQRHAAVWPEMLRALRDSGWHNYSLFARPDGLLVGYVEADDLAAAQARDGRDRGQRPLAGRDGRLLRRPARSRSPDESFQLLEQIFNLDDQLGPATETRPDGTSEAPDDRHRTGRPAIPAWTGSRRRRTKVGLVAGGLGAYWPQFPDLLPQLQRSAARVADRMTELDCEVVDVGFISDAEDGAVAAEQLRVAGCDLIVGFLTTYLTASMLMPIAQRSGAPVLLINLQPTEAMDHANFDTGQWLAYCGACPLPEMANTFLRCGIEFRSVSGYLEDERAWGRIGRWIAAAGVRSALRHGRHGLMGHLYPGMLDVSTDLTLVTANLGGHVEVIEFDDLRVRVDAVTDAEVDARMAACPHAVRPGRVRPRGDFRWAARVSVGLDRLVEDFALDSLAYYHRGLDGEQHERLGAGMILGASLLTARGIPTVGEYELRTSLAMLIVDRLGGGGSFTELQALNFTDNVVEMGHDGPAHLAISQRRPLLRGLGHLPRQAGLGGVGGVRRDARPGHHARHHPAPRRQLCRLRAREGRSSPARCCRSATPRRGSTSGCDPGEWVDALERDRHLAPLGARHRPPDRRQFGPPPTCSAWTWSRYRPDPSPAHSVTEHTT